MILGPALACALGCFLAPAPVQVELSREPTTLSSAPQLFSPGQPLPVDSRSIGVCVYPGRGYNVSGRWTVLTPDGREAQVVARVELANGKVVTLASPSSTGGSLCVHPRLGGPLEAAVQQVRLVASTPIVAERVVWRSAAR